MCNSFLYEGMRVRVCVCARVSVCSKMVFTFLSVATHSLILIYISIF